MRKKSFLEIKTSTILYCWKVFMSAIQTCLGESITSFLNEGCPCRMDSFCRVGFIAPWKHKIMFFLLVYFFWISFLFYFFDSRVGRRMSVKLLFFLTFSLENISYSTTLENIMIQLGLVPHLWFWHDWIMDLAWTHLMTWLLRSSH